MPLKVEKIENGTVIDHISSGEGLRVMKILGIGLGFSARFALIANVKSKKMGKKDILKIEEKYIDEKDFDKIALVAPSASVNIVKGGRVAKKKNVAMPARIDGVLACPNPKCITNFEQVASAFFVEKKTLRCAYCERSFSAGELI
ncbi:aspartate carbamoyltransferase regulatory subunit [Candidatus Micrarchaeota archaeon CG11_big_fil_rev_8_21_14_0_20_47_5]|nr:MAG: aspartate carbamoyltransferase regulatory subunit [Candidatus Micrarchaeota archaeon CG1_02_47_40]PIN83453.1 MAG: aspartate carbamoyltransferase regulatory subunit [Candidatus Micrarchaeota archaeon CG11_big_fil_rev_8_21_14_0_20_47_5]